MDFNASHWMICRDKSCNRRDIVAPHCVFNIVVSLSRNRSYDVQKMISGKIVVT